MDAIHIPGVVPWSLTHPQGTGVYASVHVEARSFSTKWSYAQLSSHEWSARSMWICYVGNN